MDEISKPQKFPTLLIEIQERIRSAQNRDLCAVHRGLIGPHWDIGKLIVEGQKEEGQGRAIAQRLAADLQAEFPGMGGASKDETILEIRPARV